MDRGGGRDTRGVGGHWAGGCITLGLAEEVVDGRTQERPTLLLFAHQLQVEADSLLRDVQSMFRPAAASEHIK